jgi:hypothetical protein
LRRGQTQAAGNGAARPALTRLAGVVCALTAALMTPGAKADDDRPLNLKPWVLAVPDQPTRLKVLRGLDIEERGPPFENRSSLRRWPASSVSFQNRSRPRGRLSRRDDHAAFQYRSQLQGGIRRLEFERRSDRRSFDRLQRSRREDSRIRRVRRR